MGFGCCSFGSIVGLSLFLDGLIGSVLEIYFDSHRDSANSIASTFIPSFSNSEINLSKFFKIFLSP